MKYRNLAKEVVAGLSGLGLKPLFPNLDCSNENLDQGDSPESKKRFWEEHCAAINEADVVYLITPGGYMGNSCKLELGYAVALKKPIYFSEPTNDPALDCLVSGFIKTSSLKDFTAINRVRI